MQIILSIHQSHDNFKVWQNSKQPEKNCWYFWYNWQTLFYH
jgi:hypothetical protein